MAVNLIELVKGYLTPDTVQKAASFVSESESATKKTLNGIVPTFIAALANLLSTRSIPAFATTLTSEYMVTY